MQTGTIEKMKIEEIKVMSHEGELMYGPYEDISKANENEKISRSIINPNPMQNEIIEKTKDFVIGGLASTSIIDLENEQITRQALEKIWEHLQSLDKQFRNVCVGHTSTQVGTVLLEYGNRKSALLDEGLYLICKMRQDIGIARETIEKIKAGKLNSFSIKLAIPKPVEHHIKTVCDEDKCWRQLMDGLFLELSLTDSPANLDCENTVKILS